ncbi:NUDIX hydrolase [Pseudonocardia sp.]|uniref:NUDIX domain-containing protein n=1 Tax=Pseudonocardia sp. TaxID=60912 RepID=UPI0026274966|nr:NUDIX hydrolase [Pseudonocardia sp.]
MTHADFAARPDCAAGALFVDDEGRVLIVEPTYKPRWEIPGGQVERGETPREACLRELREELGLDLPLGRLLVVDWAPHVRDEHVRFVFDGGTLTDAQLDGIELTTGELASWAFLPPDELFVMLTPRLVRRVTAALEARGEGVTSYLEHGAPAESALTPPGG